jgi:hypothetical protein
MVTTLENLARTIQAARSPVDVFGPVAGTLPQKLAQLARQLRKFLQIAHPDRNLARQKLAETVFTQLQRLNDIADKQIRAGLYDEDGKPGKTTPLFTVTLRAGSYDIFELPQNLRTTDCYALYSAVAVNLAPAGALRLKIIRDPQNNDLARHESRLLRPLNADAKIRRYFPKLVDTFALPSAGGKNRQALIIALPADLRTLAEVRAAFPKGLDPRDAAWIFNRTLEALYYTHNLGIVHGNITPDTLAVTLPNHGLILDEFPLAVPIGAPLTAIPPTFAAWFGGIATKCATPALDIVMATRTLVHLLGGNPLTADLPASIPAPLQRFIIGILRLPHARRPGDAGALRQEFDELLQQLYGPRTFRELTIPQTTTT